MEYHDIKPTNILINFEGKYQILPLPPFSKYEDSFEVGIVDLHKPKSLGINNIYLSPILMENIKNMTTPPSHDGAKSDVFTLGVSIIEAALLSPIE
jgi:serine/threonine protein kinase